MSSGKDQVGFVLVFPVYGYVGTRDANGTPDRSAIAKRASAVVMRTAIGLEQVIYELKAIPVLLDGEAFTNV
jgi:hypothetical protein